MFFHIHCLGKAGSLRRPSSNKSVYAAQTPEGLALQTAAHAVHKKADHITLGCTLCTSQGPKQWCPPIRPNQDDWKQFVRLCFGCARGTTTELHDRRGFQNNGGWAIEDGPGRYVQEAQDAGSSEYWRTHWKATTPNNPGSRFFGVVWHCEQRRVARDKFVPGKMARQRRKGWHTMCTNECEAKSSQTRPTCAVFSGHESGPVCRCSEQYPKAAQMNAMPTHDHNC